MEEKRNKYNKISIQMTDSKRIGSMEPIFNFLFNSFWDRKWMKLLANLIFARYNYDKRSLNLRDLNHDII